MKLLEERIRQEGLILSDTVLKVDSFLNHQVDTQLALEIGREFGRIFANEPITKVLTIEASGIQFAMAAGIALGVPFIYAKKKESRHALRECVCGIRAFIHPAGDVPGQRLSEILGPER